MSNKLVKFLMSTGINKAAAEAIGGKVLGFGMALNADNAGGYMNPNTIDGYTYNPADGKWYGYPPKPDLGVWGWFDPANPTKQVELTQQRYWRELNNHVERASPAQGEAGSLHGPSVLELMRYLPEIVDRYRELMPDLWYDLVDYFTPNWLKELPFNSNREPNFSGPVAGYYSPVDKAVNTFFLQMLNWRLAQDPLVLDLDGDGIEATAIDPNNLVLFDHNADGIKMATGWISADDGIVVMDRNGNGTIDSGRELFGDNTLNGATPNPGDVHANGFSAIAELDLNADGKIDSSDAAYTELRIWKDTNQNGISEAGELHTLADLNIASIGVVGTESNINLGNGNTMPLAATFTRTNGTTGTSGTPDVSGSLLLASNNFYREFTDDPEITEEAAALPQMGGSGLVRDLREAMSLETDEAGELQDSVQAFAAATSEGTNMLGGICKDRSPALTAMRERQSSLAVCYWHVRSSIASWSIARPLLRRAMSICSCERRLGSGLRSLGGEAKNEKGSRCVAV